MAIVTKYGTRVVSYVHKGDQLVDCDELGPEDKVKLGTQIRLTLLNSLYAGEATFSVREDGQEGDFVI